MGSLKIETASSAWINEASFLMLAQPPSTAYSL